jgi:hypothetical protein
MDTTALKKFKPGQIWFWNGRLPAYFIFANDADGIDYYFDDNNQLILITSITPKNSNYPRSNFKLHCLFLKRLTKIIIPAFSEEKLLQTFSQVM